jgi:mono/diheme cytochrome c family protein
MLQTLESNAMRGPGPGAGLACIVLALLWTTIAPAEDSSAVTLEQHVLPLFKSRCVKCHGPGRREGGLSLATARGLARGGKDGAVIVAGSPDESMLWELVDSDEMPPKEPLTSGDKALIRRWIQTGASGLPATAPTGPEGADHWAFAPVTLPQSPPVHDRERIRTPIDAFVQARLAPHGLSIALEADRTTLLRRVSFDLTGLPPQPDEIERFLSDPAPDAYERMVDRYLASPHYGERWGKFWLDAAGYADSNGYFAADSDRPLAYRYRDYVIRAWNDDLPLDRFVREQLAGDELAGFHPGAAITPAVVDQMVATHFLRNAPDGTGESDGNPDELRADRYAVLEGATQIVGSTLLGLTVQCARCHDHKFEPVTQADYYRFYAILRPAFDLDNWIKPQERVVEAPLPPERARWEEQSRQLDAQVAARRAEYSAWFDREREPGTIRLQDDFDGPCRLAERWSATAPRDDAPGGTEPVQIDSTIAPGAAIVDGALRIIANGAAGDRWLSTRDTFDWTPDQVGSWIEATFDLVATRIQPDAPSAERVGYFVALHDFNDNSGVAGGNVLFDGNPAGGAAVHVDYPGADAQARDTIGAAGYTAGHNYGVRITNAGDGEFLVEHLFDRVPESKTIRLRTADLPDGGFGFEYCCGRSFVVDNVRIESSPASPSAWHTALVREPFLEAASALRATRDEAIRGLEAQRGERPGRIAWVSDRSANVPPTHLLKRGLYNEPGPTIEPGPPAVLADPDNPFAIDADHESNATGRRLALARWLTRPGSRPAALLARVTVNRIWQHHFGTGLVATPENLGYSGAPPSHPDLLEYLAAELIGGGWRTKPLHRLVLLSSTYRQSAAPRPEGSRLDPENRLLGRYPMRRLDAEAIRDAMLAAAGDLDRRMTGPFVPTRAQESGEVVVETAADAGRRSVYLQQRRSRVLSVLEVFDAPSIVTSCTRRSSTTIPLQSLSLLNNSFTALCARGLARRAAGSDDAARIERAFELAIGRPPADDELDAARRFLADQPARYAGEADAHERAWCDLCQMILASNAFLYVE